MPNAAQLQIYAGRYGNAEAGSPAEVTAGDHGVAMRFGRGSKVHLMLPAASADLFRRGSMVARFHRDDTGAVVGFSYSDPLSAVLRFSRLADGDAASAELHQHVVRRHRITGLG